MQDRKFPSLWALITKKKLIKSLPKLVAIIDENCQIYLSVVWAHKSII